MWEPPGIVVQDDTALQYENIGPRFFLCLDLEAI